MTLFRGITFLAAGPASERNRSATNWSFRMHFLRYLSLALLAAALSAGALRADQPVEPLPDLLIGYTEFR